MAENIELPQVILGGGGRGAAQKGKVSLPRLFIIIIRILVKDGSRHSRPRSSTLGETHARLVCSPPTETTHFRDWEWWEHVAFGGSRPGFRSRLHYLIAGESLQLSDLFLQL